MGVASLNLSVQRLKEEEKQNFAWLGVLPEDARIMNKMTVKRIGSIIRGSRKK